MIQLIEKLEKLRDLISNESEDNAVRFFRNFNCIRYFYDEDVCGALFGGHPTALNWRYDDESVFKDLDCIQVPYDKSDQDDSYSDSQWLFRRAVFQARLIDYICWVKCDIDTLIENYYWDDDICEFEIWDDDGQVIDKAEIIKALDEIIEDNMKS